MKVHLKQRLVQLSEAYGFKPEMPAKALSRIASGFSLFDLTRDITYRWPAVLVADGVARRVVKLTNHPENKSDNDSAIQRFSKGTYRYPLESLPAKVGRLGAAYVPADLVDDFVDEVVRTNVKLPWSHYSGFWKLLRKRLVMRADQTEDGFWDSEFLPSVTRLTSIAFTGDVDNLTLTELLEIAPELKHALLKLRAASNSTQVSTLVTNLAYGGKYYRPSSYDVPPSPRWTPDESGKYEAPDPGEQYGSKAYQQALRDFYDLVTGPTRAKLFNTLSWIDKVKKLR